MASKKMEAVLANMIHNNPKVPVMWMAYIDYEELGGCSLEMVGVMATKYLKPSCVRKYGLDDEKVYFIEDDEGDMPDLIWHSFLIEDPQFDNLPEEEKYKKVQKAVRSLQWLDCIRVNFE